MMNNLLQRIQSVFGYRLQKEDHHSIQAAYDIALKTLRERYTAQGIQAGRFQFSDLWLRDSCFAAFGALAVGDIDIVKTNLITVFDYMKSDGQVPLRIGQKNMLLKFMGFKGKTQARFVEDKGVSVPTDCNSLFVITTEKYISQTQDKLFLHHYYNQLKSAMDWNFTQDEDDDLLIEEGFYAGWADSVRKRGKVMYTNVLHFQALGSFAKLCQLAGRSGEEKHYLKLQDRVRKGLHERFWNGSYYIDWIHRHKHLYFSSDGNVLAIVFGLADTEQAKKIQLSIHNFDLDHTFSTKTNFPHYRYRHIFPLFFPIKIHDYHNGLEWLWIGCADVVAKQRIGMTRDAYELLIRLSKKIVEYNGVYEVYHNGKPLTRLFYQSEQGFAWSSGMFVWACKTIGVV